eukprot:3312958-Alexandrium_andersonii.AAC.1
MARPGFNRAPRIDTGKKRTHAVASGADTEAAFLRARRCTRVEDALQPLSAQDAGLHIEGIDVACWTGSHDAELGFAVD